MKTKVIKINLERKQDVMLGQDYEWDGETPPCGLKKLKERIYDGEKVWELVRQDYINESIEGGKIISISSKIVGDFINFSPIEEVTVNYE